MGKQILDENVMNLISGTENRIYQYHTFVGDKEYNISVFSEQSENVYYVVVSDNDTLISIQSVREDLDEKTAARMNKDLIKRIRESLPESYQIESVRSDAESVSECEQPVMLKINTSEKLVGEDGKIIIISSEITDWMNELKVIPTSKVSKQQAEDYQMEYEKIMSADMIPHEKDEKDFSRTMCLITLIFAIVSVFFYDMCFFPVITIVSGIFSAYRCYTNKNNTSLVICIICIVVGIVFTCIGWNQFTLSMNNAV
ncbi:MAG: hypothetical protein ACI39R_00615 [Lachnospiraceae bacterium]